MACAVALFILGIRNYMSCQVVRSLLNDIMLQLARSSVFSKLQHEDTLWESPGAFLPPDLHHTSMLPPTITVDLQQVHAIGESRKVECQARSNTDLLLQ